MTQVWSEIPEGRREGDNKGDTQDRRWTATSYDIDATRAIVLDLRIIDYPGEEEFDGERFTVPFTPLWLNPYPPGQPWWRGSDGGARRLAPRVEQALDDLWCARRVHFLKRVETIVVYYIIYIISGIPSIIDIILWVSH